MDPFRAHPLLGCRLLIACVPPHVDVGVDSVMKPTDRTINDVLLIHKWRFLGLCFELSFDLNINLSTAITELVS